MLTQREKESSYAALKEVIHEVTGDHNATYAQGDFDVHASVEEVTVFSNAANCHFQIDHHDGKVSVYWEEAGLEDFSERGLFGRMSTNYQQVRKLPAGVLEVVGLAPQYKVLINYRS